MDKYRVIVMDGDEVQLDKKTDCFMGAVSADGGIHGLVMAEANSVVILGALEELENIIKREEEATPTLKLLRKLVALGKTNAMPNEETLNDIVNDLCKERGTVVKDAEE